MQNFIAANRLLLVFTLLFVLPSLLCAWMPIKEPEKHVKQGINNDIFSLTNDYVPGDQVVYIDSFISRQSKEEEKESNIRPNRYGTVYSDHQIESAPVLPNPDYSYDVELTYNENEADSYYQEETPADCKKKRRWKDFSKKTKASIILGSIGLALGKLNLLSSLASLLIVEDTTTTSTTSTTSTSTSTSTTSTTSTTTSTTTTTSRTTTTTPSTTSTSTTTTTMMPMTCSTTSTATTGTYKTIRNPGNQVEQCVSITVAAGSRIQMICTSVYTAGGTYVTILDQSGTSIIANPPAVNVPYTSVDNTLLIKSLASSANSDTLCCTWTTV